MVGPSPPPGAPHCCPRAGTQTRMAPLLKASQRGTGGGARAPHDSHAARKVLPPPPTQARPLLEEGGSRTCSFLETTS